MYFLYTFVIFDMHCVCVIGVECIDFPLLKKIDALSGSCVLIKCTIKTLYEISEGFWIVNRTQRVVFNSSTSSPVFKGSIIGKLKEKNCTTIFYDISLNHSGIYSFIEFSAIINVIGE